MNIVFHRNFEKEYKKLRKSEKQRAMAQLSLFEKDPFAPLLSNHPLKGKYVGYRSVSIGDDLRAIYRLIGRGTAIFVVIGMHSKLYSS